MSKFIEIIITTPDKKTASKISKCLLLLKLAACSQISGPITSYYWWKNKLEVSKEWLCLIKSEKKMFNKIENEIKKIHPYEVPQIIAFPIETGSKSYLNWIHEEITNKNS